MADIDIEEHDVFENPMLKRIFPDLSILKKETIDFTKESNGIISSEDGVLNTLTVSNNKSSCGNKKTCNSHIKKEKNIKNAKVILVNINPFLTRSKKFCQMCLILFPDNCSLDTHNNFLHYKTNIFKDNINNDSIINSDFYAPNKKKQSSSVSVIRDANVMLSINIPKNSFMKSTLRSCVHCDVLFPTEKLLIDHLYDILNAKKSLKDIEKLKKPYSNAKNKQSMTNVMFKQKFYCCIICSYYFDSRNIYIQHLLENHHFSAKITNSTVKFKPICKFCNTRCSNKASYNTHLHLTHKEEMKVKQNIEEYLSKTTSYMEKYSKRKVKYDISNSKNYPKEAYNNSNIQDSRLKNIFINNLKTTLFKCMKCKIFFLTLETAMNHNEHSQLINNWKCLKCHRILKERDSKEHNEQHNFSTNYFMESAVFDKGYDDLYKCEVCTVYYKQDDIFNHQILCDSKTPNSSYCEVCDILIEQDIYISHKKSHECEHITNSESNLFKNYVVKDNVDTKRKIQTASRVLKKRHYFRKFYYCNLCECNISQESKVDHLKLNCMKLTKRICEYCGLAFQNKSFLAHKRFHWKYSNVKLQEFAFYDLQTKRNLKPRQTLPKCKTCEKHFIHQSEVINHLCNEDNYLVCSICNIKLTAAAFKLHMPFHSYKLRSNMNNLPQSNQNRKDKNMDCDIEEKIIVGRNIVKSGQNIKLDIAMYTGAEKLSPIYTCINCNISMNAYDEAIRHCHMHSNLNNLYLGSIECVTCNLKFVVACYNAHQDLHISLSKDQFKQFTFDILYFGSKNDTWINHLFGSIPTNCINRFMGNSIYKDEHRIKLKVTQHGLARLTIYNCDKCQRFVDSQFIYKHMAGCCTNSEKYSCKFCNLPFVNRSYRNKHEVFHSNCTINPKLYRIVTFNREEDKSLNIHIANIKKYYVLYQCRSCNVVVDKSMYQTHKCYSTSELKKCCKCGLLIYESEYNLHINYHNSRHNFNKDYMYVNLLGSDNKNKSNNVRSNFVSSFTGMISDYTFFKCAKCDICVRDHRSTIKHFCLIKAAKSECPKCGLIFDEEKLKGHLKLHETDPDFTKDAIMIKTFREEEIKDNENSVILNTQENNNLSIEEVRSDEDVFSTTKLYSDTSSLYTVKIFKCSCGLHFLNKTTVKEHSEGCSGKINIKQSKQNCLKCGLTFSNDILFQHLLRHHKGKHVSYKYDIIEI